MFSDVVRAPNSILSILTKWEARSSITYSGPKQLYAQCDILFLTVKILTAKAYIRLSVSLQVMLESQAKSHPNYIT